ncbi:MAG: amino acid permease [Gammaproteobacteria bacterium]|nr:amino acid permease [Gammaproteobacteria bacterium]
MITTGIVIGAGIFSAPAAVAQLAGSGPATLAAWVLGGVLSLIGALCYAELAGSYPSRGGDYAFLRRAYGRDFSFFYAWARIMVITTGSIALLGFVLGDYLSSLLDLGRHSSALYALGAVCLLTALNLAGLRWSTRLQTPLTLIEIGGLLLVALAGWLIPAAATPAAGRSALPEVGAFGAALVFVLLAYGGWNDAAYVSAEVRGGARAVRRTLLTAVVLISLLYLLFIVAALRGLGVEGLRASGAPGAELMRAAFGEPGARLLAAIVAVTALTSMNATLLVGARASYALGRDWPLFAALALWQEARGVPRTGLLVQGGIAVALILFGAVEKSGFATMVEFTAPVFWFFFMMSALALLILRRREPAHPRPFHVPLYPLLPLVFALTCAGLLYSSIVYARSQRAGYVALAVMAVGAFAWLLARSRRR